MPISRMPPLLPDPRPLEACPSVVLFLTLNKALFSFNAKEMISVVLALTIGIWLSSVLCEWAYLS